MHRLVETAHRGTRATVDTLQREPVLYTFQYTSRYQSNIYQPTCQDFTRKFFRFAPTGACARRKPRTLREAHASHYAPCELRSLALERARFATRAPSGARQCAVMLGN